MRRELKTQLEEALNDAQQFKDKLARATALPPKAGTLSPSESLIDSLNTVIKGLRLELEAGKAEIEEAREIKKQAE